MKFKRVEIQAFRAYDKARNGTFDFSTKSNDTADFISIYAPNGFGKTSFYDAIEWAFTNNINRFLRKYGANSALAKAERSLSSKEGHKTKHFILRNKHSDPDLEGYVKILTTNNQIVLRRIPNIRAGQSDFKFDPSATESTKGYFQDVLLSQEWISAFLREDNAELRYDKFIQYFGDTELDSHYKLLTSLTNANNNKIKALRKELTGLTSNFNPDLDADLLIEINEKIDQLTKKGHRLPRIDIKFTEKDFVNFANMISEKIIELSTQSLNIDNQIERIEKIRTRITEYFDAKENLARLAEELNGLRDLKKLVEKRKEYENQISNLRKEFTAQNEKREKFLTIKSLLPRFEQITDEIKKRNVDLNGKQDELRQSKLKLHDLNQEILDLEIRNKALINEQIELKNLEIDLPKNFKLLDENRSKITTLQRLLDEQADQIKINNAKIDLVKEEIVELKLIIENINDDEFLASKKVLTTSMRGNQKQLSNLKSEIETINVQILAQESFDKELEEFISKGIELVDINQLNICPLCSTEFKSYKSLATKISKNSILSASLQLLLSERSKLEEKSIEAGLLKEKSKSDLVNECKNRIEKLQDSLGDLTDKINDLSQNYNSNENNLIGYKAELTRILTNLESWSQKTFQETLALKSEANKIKIKNIRSQLINKLESRQIIEKKIVGLEDEISFINKLLKELSDESAYIEINHLQSELLIKEKITDKIIDRKIDLLNIEIDKIIGSEKIIISEVIELKRLLASVDENELGSKIKNFEIGMYKFNEIILSFNRFFETELNFVSSNIANESVIRKIDDGISRLKVTLAFLEQSIDDFDVINKFKENVLPFLKNKRIERSINEIQKQILTKERISDELHNEKGKLSDFINNQVESFFYEDLINRLYKKIDPHPEYKKIKFKCDFSDDKPKLNIFVNDKNNDNSLVPNLYFSTAQLNILSLSIFLAKALNAKDERGEPIDCIFIDDPIQSMDSINTLSTIDLLRSIVVNFKKQIILSTHDDNFHNLLKKKIPENLFKAKYIELETVGKVK